MYQWLTILLLATTLVGCKAGQSILAVSDQALATSAEDAVTTISGILDDQEGEAYATQQQKSYPDMLDELLFPKAYADGCIRPVFKVCDNGLKSSVFQDCSMFRNQVVASGLAHVVIRFQEACLLSILGVEQELRKWSLVLAEPPL